MVHHIVKFICKFSCWISYIYRRHHSILPIAIITNKHKHTKVFIGTLPCIPELFKLTILYCFWCSRCIWNYLKLWFSHVWCYSTWKCCPIKTNYNVRWCCTRESNTVWWVVPTLRWIKNISHCIFMYINKFGICILLKWYVIRSTWIYLENLLSFATLCFVWWEVVKCYIVYFYFSHPCAIWINTRHWKFRGWSNLKWFGSVITTK